jgi:hypothetical protein
MEESAINVKAKKFNNLLAPATVFEVKGFASLSAETDLGPAKNLLKWNV